MATGRRSLVCKMMYVNRFNMEHPAESDDGTVAANMHAHYASLDDLDTQSRFRDLDTRRSRDEMIQLARSSTSKNFVVEFNDDAAHAAFDLSTASFDKLLSTRRPDASSVRWINMWYPYSQQAILELLARRYDFSPRLLGLMCSNPRLWRSTPPKSPLKQAGRRAAWHARSHPSLTLSEVEKGSDELSDLSSISSYDSIARGNLYRIVDDTWHYSSVDCGRSYVCLGYNSLYGTRPAGNDDIDGLLPHYMRIWTWLILCEDSTVITINEDPFPYAEGRLDVLQQRIVQETRRNLVNVFRSLSRVEEDMRMAPSSMTLLPIRTRLGDTPEETAHRDTDSPGLLLYYLFENWYNSYTLVTRKESRYGVELSSLRSRMFKSPQLCHIDRLDTIGKELGVLKRHYQSHNHVIDRLLEPQVATVASLQGSHIISVGSEVSLDTVRPLVTEQESLLGVSLSSAARVRFRRLKDLIDLYALSEVEECMKQKDSLVTLNFNLIAMKESVAMERLTKVTLLITKATILFLPVSLMSAYFSINLGNVQYTVKEYWVSFSVIFCLSWLALFVFGVFSGSVQTLDFFRGLWVGSRDMWRQIVKKS